MMALLRFLFGRRAPEPSALEIARRERRAAAEAYANAKARGDTRETHHAHRRFRRVTNEILRLELERRA